MVQKYQTGDGRKNGVENGRRGYTGTRGRNDSTNVKDFYNPMEKKQKHEQKRKQTLQKEGKIDRLRMKRKFTTESQMGEVLLKTKVNWGRDLIYEEKIQVGNGLRTDTTSDILRQY